MHLNIDCVRDVMLTVESNALGNQLTLSSLSSTLPQYSSDEVEYACLKLDEGGLLDIITVNANGRSIPFVARINELTFYGHEFLESIKSESVWKKTKGIAQNIGSSSLDVLKTVASSVIMELIKHSL